MKTQQTKVNSQDISNQDTFKSYADQKLKTKKAFFTDKHKKIGQLVQSIYESNYPDDKHFFTFYSDIFVYFAIQDSNLKYEVQATGIDKDYRLVLQTTDNNIKLSCQGKITCILDIIFFCHDNFNSLDFHQKFVQKIEEHLLAGKDNEISDFKKLNLGPDFRKAILYEEKMSSAYPLGICAGPFKFELIIDKTKVLINQISDYKAFVAIIQNECDAIFLDHTEFSKSNIFDFITNTFQKIGFDHNSNIFHNQNVMKILEEIEEFDAKDVKRISSTDLLDLDKKFFSIQKSDNSALEFKYQYVKFLVNCKVEFDELLVGTEQLAIALLSATLYDFYLPNDVLNKVYKQEIKYLDFKLYFDKELLFSIQVNKDLDTEQFYYGLYNLVNKSSTEYFDYKSNYVTYEELIIKSRIEKILLGVSPDHAVEESGFLE